MTMRKPKQRRELFHNHIRTFTTIVAIVSLPPAFAPKALARMAKAMAANAGAVVGPDGEELEAEAEAMAVNGNEWQ